jgi:fengycin family lipopeptide synthetase B
VTKAFIGAMRARGSGRIINVASISGRLGTAQLTAYCAAKHGVIGLTRALAEELRGDGLAVNAICPGSVDTEMLSVGMPGAKPLMSPEDVARVALFLAADAPLAMTGSCVDVFG